LAFWCITLMHNPAIVKENSQQLLDFALHPLCFLGPWGWRMLSLRWLHLHFQVTCDENLELLRAYLQKFFKLELVNMLDKPTTQGKTCIDLTFAWGIQIISKPYISYFSYH
jgi:hypothetical protein